jgi:hypothetical protein
MDSIFEQTEDLLINSTVLTLKTIRRPHVPIVVHPSLSQSRRRCMEAKLLILHLIKAAAILFHAFYCIPRPSVPPHAATAILAVDYSKRTGQRLILMSTADIDRHTCK